MLTKQILELDRKTGDIHLINTYDVSEVLEENHDLQSRNTGMRQTKHGHSGNLCLKARIPAIFVTGCKDPDLIAGLVGKDAKALDRWLDNHPKFRISPKQQKGKRGMTRVR